MPGFYAAVNTKKGTWSSTVTRYVRLPLAQFICCNRVLVNQETEKPETKRNETGHAHLSMRST